MSNILQIRYRHIFLFETGSLKKLQVNPLKDFLYFLKSEGQRGVIDFAYSWESDSLHNQMSIKENFLLDSIPTSLIRDREHNLIEFIENLENPYLKELIQSLGNLDQVITDLSKEHQKLTSIIKALLSQSEYVFLVEPEKICSPKLITSLKKCIQFEVDNNHRKFMIRPSDKATWLEIATHFVSKNERHQYIKTHNPEHNKNHSKSIHSILPILKKIS